VCDFVENIGVSIACGRASFFNTHTLPARLIDQVFYAMARIVGARGKEEFLNFIVKICRLQCLF
jgi:hypothetical protein